MKSFKHIISYACDKNCSYCINEILVHNEKQCKKVFKVAEAYEEMALKGYDHIMISGGEPVLNKMFEPCVRLAKMMFKHVSIISAHNSILSNHDIAGQIDDVLFSIHVEYLDDFKEKMVFIDKPVYASMVYETYLKLRKLYGEPLSILDGMGYAGATIRETYPNGKMFSPSDLVTFKTSKTFTSNDFSVRWYTTENCVKDSVLLLPDLTTTTQKEFA